MPWFLGQMFFFPKRIDGGNSDGTVGTSAFHEVRFRPASERLVGTEDLHRLYPFCDLKKKGSGLKVVEPWRLGGGLKNQRYLDVYIYIYLHIRDIMFEYTFNTMYIHYLHSYTMFIWELYRFRDDCQNCDFLPLARWSMLAKHVPIAVKTTS